MLSIMTIIIVSTSPNKVYAANSKMHLAPDRKGVQACIVNDRWGVKCSAPFSTKCKADDGCKIVGSTVIQSYFPSVTTIGQWLETNPENNDEFIQYLDDNNILNFD